MTDSEKERLALALGLLSGRIEQHSLNVVEYHLLGYDTAEFRYYLPPTIKEILGQAEDIVFNLLVKAMEK